MILDTAIEACLPNEGPLREYMQWAIKTTDAEHIFHLGAILPCLANEVVEAGFFVDAARMIRPSIWSFLVGVPASSKSTAMKRAHAHIKQVRGTLSSFQAPDPFIMAEGSIPGLFEALSEAYSVDTGLSSGVLYRDEAGRLLESKDHGVADMLCNIIDGESVKRHLRSLKEAARGGAKVNDQLKNPVFSGTMATTFSRLREVTVSSFIEGGLYSRFLWFTGQPRLVDPRLEVDLHRDEQQRVVHSWVDWGRWLSGMMLVCDQEQGRRVVELSAAAHEVLRDTLFAAFKAAVGTESRMNATRKRGLTQAVIVAGLYALSQRRTEISPADMLAATNLVALSTRSLSMLDGDFTIVDETADVQRVYEVIRTAGSAGCSKGAVYREIRITKRALDTALEVLAEQSRVMVEPITRPNQRGRREIRLTAAGEVHERPSEARKPDTELRTQPSPILPKRVCGHCEGSGAEPGTEGRAACGECDGLGEITGKA